MSNFAVLDRVVPEMAHAGKMAEAVFAADPRAAIIHLRIFGELMALHLLNQGRLHSPAEQFERIRLLSRESILDRSTSDAFHTIRKHSNAAAHAYGIATHGEAMRALKAASRLSNWFWQHHTARTPPKPTSFVRPTAASNRNDKALAKALEDAETEYNQRLALLEQQLATANRLNEMPQVALHHRFEEQYRTLSDKAQADIAGFLDAFRTRPIDDDWPLEQPEGMTDPKVRLVQGANHTLVVFQPPRGDVLIVVFVDTRQGAIDWATHQRFEVHPVLGTVQMYDAVEAGKQTAHLTGGLFAEFPDEALLALGTPEPLLASLRRVENEQQLEELYPVLPPECADGLACLASGYTLDEALAELDRIPPEDVAIDTDDFCVAVHHPESQRSIVVVDDAQELADVLNLDVDAWRTYLHPDQRKLVNMRANGPVRVLGGAGTGKTVALLHRTRHLLETVYFEPQDRILVTTYTKNLAADLGQHLTSMLNDEQRQRVTVANLHAYVGSLWQQHGTGQYIAYAKTCQNIWANVHNHDTLGLTVAFYQAEWDRVVQANDITSEKQYLKARRDGRGVRLTFLQRREVWKVFDAYRTALTKKNCIEWADQLRFIRQRIENGTIPRVFQSALVDELQDLGPQELKFIRALIPEQPSDLFLVGDAHQRIYSHPVRLGRCGINIRGRRSRRLKVNYRTTAQVRSLAVSVLGDEPVDDMDGGADELRGYRSLRAGTTPRITLHRNQANEHADVIETVTAWLADGPPESICLAAPTNSRVAALAKLLAANGITSHVIDAGTSDQGAGVRLATLHRMKGLEFPRVLLTCIQDGTMPYRHRGWDEMSNAEKAESDQRQRCLFYVAATRARDELVVLGHGLPSPVLRAWNTSRHTA